MNTCVLVIKNPKVLRAGYRYEFKPRKGDTKEDKWYRFAAPADYADGCWLGDCYLQDKDGNQRPGYEWPVPIEVSNLKNGRRIAE